MLIGEVSRRSGVSVRMLRHYDRIGLVSPSGRSAAGYREYAAADLRRLFRAEALRTLGLSLAQVAAALDEPGFDAAAVIADLRHEAERRIARDRALIERLDDLGAAETGVGATGAGEPGGAEPGGAEPGTAESCTAEPGAAPPAAEPRSWERVLDTVALLAALRSPSPRDRQAAALRSGTGGATAVPQLVRAYLAERETNAAGALRWAIARAGEPAAIALAERVRDPDARVRLRVVRALDDLEGSAAGAALAVLLDDADDEVADRAALALAARAAAGARAEAAAVANARVRERLVGMIVAGSRDVEAAEALGALATADPGEAAAIAAALEGGLGVPEAPGGSAPRGSRSRIAQALGDLPGARARSLLRGLRDDPDPAVARVSEYLLGREETPGPGRRSGYAGGGGGSRRPRGTGAPGAPGAERG